MSVAQAHALLNQPGSPLELTEAIIGGVKLKVWKHAPPTMRDVFQLSAAWPERVHLVYEDERVTFAALHGAVAKFAAQLAADGVKKGDRVALIMRNIPEWPVVFWATVSLGAISTPLNAWWTGPELEYGLADSGSTVAIMDAERWERVREHVDATPALKKIYVARAREEISDPKAARLESVIGGPKEWAALPKAALPATPLQTDEDCAIFYTSGTTGKPKGAIITHRNIISNMFNAANTSARAYLRRGEAPPQPKPDDPQKAMLLSVPFFHATGCMAILAPYCMTGGKIVLQRRWDVDAALPLIEREKITQVGGVPTIAWQIVEHPRLGDYDLSSLELVAYGGAPGAPELVKRIETQFKQAMPGHGWGRTETSATAISHIGEEYQVRPSSCGTPPMTGEAKIMRADGTEAPIGEVGELWYRGPVVARGYWQKPQATAETFVDGWVKTGDLARRDEENFYFIVDRAKDMLIRGGENIYCIEVENALYDHPAVMDAGVIGLPHKTLGEEPAAVVTLKPDASASEEELRHWVAQRLAAFKVPVRLAFWPETLPRNANGKIMKKELRAAFPDVTFPA
ncbi:MAG: class I adenylate-forming enzyme family protein [Hyphomonadaceae bacterium]